MTERVYDQKISSRASKRAGFIATSALGMVSIASIAAICGGSGEQKDTGNSDVNGNQAQVTRQVESPTVASVQSPTAVATEATVTEAPPTFEEMAELIRMAYGGRTFSPAQMTTADYPNSDSAITFLRACNSYGGPIVLGSFTSYPSEPNYRVNLLSGCEGVGGALKDVFNITQEDIAFEANQKMFLFHKAVFDLVKNEGRTAPESYMDAVKAKVYNLEPAVGK